MNVTQTVRRAGALVVEALCPLIILALVTDSAGQVVWNCWADRDVEIYATIARFWQHGLIPYRDLYDFKPPLTLIALRIGYALWGYEPESLRYVILMLLAFGAGMMYLGLRRSGNLLAAPLASLGLVTLVVADPWHIISQNTELLAMVWCAAAFGCAAAHQRNGQWWWAAGSGACLGLAALGKQPAALFALPVVAQLWLWGMRGNFWQRCRYALTRAALAAAGFAAVVGCFVLYFAYHGAAKAFYEAVVVDGCRYAGVGAYPWSSFLKRPTAQLLFVMIHDGNESMWPFFAGVAMIVPLTLIRPSRWIAVMWLWVLASYVAVVAGPRSEWHYLMLLFPGLSLAVGIGVELAAGAGPDPQARQSTRRLAGGVLIALFVYGGTWRAHHLHQGALPSVSASEAEIESVGQRIRAAATPGDTLFVKDEPYQIYMYAEIPPLTRFIYPDSPAPNAVNVWASALQQRPTFIVISHGTQERLPNAQSGLEGDLAKMLAADYELWFDGPVGMVYRHTDHAPAASTQPSNHVAQPPAS
jgi:hypothetical protein